MNTTPPTIAAAMFAQMADKLPYMTKIGHGWRWRLRYRIIVARLENQVLAGEPRR